MKVVRFGLAIALASLTTLVFVTGCGGYSTEEAEEWCTQEEAARASGGCFSDATFTECVAAYEDCGDDVNVNDSCPLTYTCDE